LGGPTYFEALRIGQRFPLPSRTVTEAQFLAFQAVSGDNHPLHYDREYCRRLGHRDLLAHGFQTLAATAAGAGQFPHLIGEALVAFLSQACRFLKPVYLGDTLYPVLEIVGLEPQRTTGVVAVRAAVWNQRGELCLDGEQRYLVARAPAGE
jgi:acyl dehydratase